MIEGTRRVEKSTVAENFGKNEYDSYILIDFSICSQNIKHLVKDERYGYLETGSLISIKKNVANILIPGEEREKELQKCLRNL